MSARVGATVFAHTVYPDSPSARFVFFWFFGCCAWKKERRKRKAEKRRRTGEIRCHSVQSYTVYTPIARFIFFGFFGFVLYHIIEPLSLTTDRAMALLWGSAPDPVGGSPPNHPERPPAYEYGARSGMVLRVYGAARSRRTEEISCLKHRKILS
jgi:hypothetical protein